MERRIIYVNNNQRELVPPSNNSLNVLIEHENIHDFIRCRVPFHWHPELEMIAVTEGSLICQGNEISRTLHAGEGLIFNSNALHGYLADGEQPGIYNAVLFDPSIFAPIGSQIYEKYITPILTNPALSCISLLEAVDWQKEIYASIVEIGKIDLSDSSCKEFRMLECLVKIWYLLSENTTDTVAKSPQAMKDIARMKQAMTFVQNACSEPVTLDEIAASCSLSQSECCRLFRRILNQSPMEYVISCRIRKSMALLSDETLSITEIAGLSGFQSSSYFSETFRRLTGMTPSKYKKQLSKNS